MKKINDITVKVTYTVGLSNVQVSDELYEAICNSYDNGYRLGSDCDSGDDACDATDWISSNIRESDAMDWEYEIEDLDVDDD